MSAVSEIGLQRLRGRKVPKVLSVGLLPGVNRAKMTPAVSMTKAVSNEHNLVRREMVGLVCIFFGLFTMLSLITYDPLDPSLNQVVSSGRLVHNGAGIVGSYLAGLIVDLFGIGAFVWPIAFLALALSRFFPPLAFSQRRWAGLLLTTFCFMIWAVTPWPFERLSIVAVCGGGFFGHAVYRLGIGLITLNGALLVWLFTFFCALQLLSGLTWFSLGKRLNVRLVDFLRKRQERLLRREKRRRQQEGKEAVQGACVVSVEEDDTIAAGQLQISKGSQARPFILPAARSAFLVRPAADKVSACITTSSHDIIPIAPYDGTADGEDAPSGDDAALSVTLSPRNGNPTVTSSLAVTVSAPTVLRSDNMNAPVRPGYRSPSLTLFPGLDLLTVPQRQGTAVSVEELHGMAEALVTCLADFGVQGEVQSISPGPVVTMFEYRPAPGIKISRISSLSDDLALALKATAVRIEAPIPGKDLIGVEIPNLVRQTVSLRDILASEVFQGASSLLTLALGVDIADQPRTADLARMPHLLVAGATGAGKSVCLNSILLSFLFKARPDQVKLLLIDPKRIELAVYTDLPHLVHPVVTDMSLAKNALDWAVYEMEQRYDAIARMGVRNIESYNVKVGQFACSKNEASPELATLEPMPYLVIVIDELADLMLTAAKDVEMSVVRLAQLARAAGIHMILATQRPSVDVVTGLIKANFPCRISFQVTSKHDARTILDTVGSERLLGKGDMLFKPWGGKLQRMHGAFVSDEDVAAIVGFWKSQAKPEYRINFSEWNSGSVKSEGGWGMGGDDIINDPIYAKAVEFVTSQGKASISLVQRRFRIGYNKAARFIEQMEVDGYIGASDGSRPRPVFTVKK
ncbi:DNA segregation ATPase FtsK/SpoIIIE, S-DNA-T family [Desulfovibrionales bacterium]